MKTLIAWFSWSGNTETVAAALRQKAGGDLFRIEREIPYSSDYHTCAYTEARAEAEGQLLPALRGPLPDIGAYDAVILAFPIWWYTAPRPVISFLKSDPDWRGKRIFVFANACSDIPAQFANALRDVMAAAPGAQVRPGLYGLEMEALPRWLRENGFARCGSGSSRVRCIRQAVSLR